VFSTTGSSDALLYPSSGDVAGDANGSPANRGYIAEVNYLPWLNTKLQLQYVGYSKFNGTATDYAGIGRNASGNNALYLLVCPNCAPFAIRREPTPPRSPTCGAWHRSSTMQRSRLSLSTTPRSHQRRPRPRMGSSWSAVSRFLTRTLLPRASGPARPATARSRGNNIFPRRAGQHADYLVKQMLVIQSALRAAPVMHGVIKDLPQDQMRAVATYLESLGS
jgi:hypothetical protein